MVLLQIEAPWLRCGEALGRRLAKARQFNDLLCGHPERHREFSLLHWRTSISSCSRIKALGMFKESCVDSALK
ncbi:predicted protein [Uncinocarpus reesii 1704]|uniref:Uncharacterized protein n=1 Tax=Uncinocarpus reesii (strain UAMH 1704) TaxID=336963 RepID=C4JW50_UNCRE|nr:uncharacterized protein UREG_06792 [Uncinocarpus reesii 1704]EEP81927.1 predicted protein [Uncinocarpus reesii 1704]